MHMRLTAVAMAALLAIAPLAGCAAISSENGTATNGFLSSIHEPEHLTDNDSLYDNQDDTSVQTMYLTVSTGSKDDGTNHTWAEVNQHSAYYYEEKGIDKYEVEGLLQVGDKNGPEKGQLGYGQTVPNATVKIRGHSSSLIAEKSYKIELDNGRGTWNGQHTINLNKHPFDGLRFRNKLGYSMLQSIPQLTSLRTQFVHLYVRDTTKGGSGKFEDYGLYTQVEELDEDALRAHGLDSKGQLYQVNNFEFRRYKDAIKLASDPDYDEETFEDYLEVNGTNNNHSKLIAMLDDVNDESAPIEDVISEHFDIENLSYWMAFNLLTGNIDTQSQNYFLYSPSDSDTWYFLCWDMDGMMFYDEDSVEGRLNYTSWHEGVSNYWGNILLRRCLQSESFRSYLQTAIDDLHQNELSEASIKKWVNEYQPIAEPYTYADSTKWRPLTRKQYNRIAKNLPALVDFYYKKYQESLTKPMPFFIGTPVVADNQMTINWDASYDLNGEALTYTATIASDPQMKNVVATYTGSDTSTLVDAPESGTYYLKVSVANASGKTQDAFDSIRQKDGNHLFGEISFTIGADGSVTRN